MRILQYQGLSLMSRAIRWQTRSAYSHTALELDDGSVIEAWTSGVRHTKTPWTDHKKGTVVDFYEIKAEFDSAFAESWLRSQIGKKYDFQGIVRFMTRRDHPENDSWFCSELALTALDKAGVSLLHLPSAHASPRDVGISPLLKLVDSQKR